ncbi:uncharacterized protein [Watersipora subatra]|uniref:uncharacterized protein n=1 Tax=Watersipora subatra TaxID=2589382 RepID=UPI00355AF894
MSSSRHSVLFCAVGNCEEIKHLFAWPRGQSSTDAQRAKWTAFVKKHVADFQYRTSSRICFRHFTKECFSNYYQYKYLTEESVRLILKKQSDIIPSCGASTATDSIGTSRKEPSTPPLPARERRAVIRELLRKPIPLVPRTVTCPPRPKSKKRVHSPQPAEAYQPVKPLMVDKGTQLRKCLHRPKYRSVAIQTDPKRTGLPETAPTKRRGPVVKAAWSIPASSEQLPHSCVIIKRETDFEVHIVDEKSSELIASESLHEDGENTGIHGEDC